MSEEQLQEMSFWSHLDALRAVLIRIAIVVVVAAVALFIVMPSIFDAVILAPCHSDFITYRWLSGLNGLPMMGDMHFGGDDVKLINIQLASQLYIHMSTSCYLALVVTFPVILYLLWTFIAPALYAHERRGAVKAFLLGNVMFYVGVLVGYFSIFPVCLRFLADYHVSEMVPNQISLDSYMDTFFMLILMMGVMFEIPLLSWLLGSAGLLHRGFFSRYRRHAIVALVVAAAMITPTGDPFTLAIVFLPLYVLYELSALLVPAAEKSTE